LKPITKRIWKRAKRVIALSQSLKETALKTAPNQKIHVIPNGIETNLFKPHANTKENNGELKLITVSRLIRRKGIDQLLAALARIQDKSIKLLVVGTGSQENHLKNLCKDLHLNNAVEFYGYCPRERLPQLYDKSDVFILPSLAESFGMVFVEAMASSLPIIAAKTGGVVDLVKKENGILVQPGNIEEIKKAIVTMKNSYDMRVTMGKANRKRVIEHYSWKSVTQKYLEIYQTLQYNELKL